MADKIKVWCFLLFLLKLVSNLQNCAHAAPQVPCFFIFGDSLADSGNNNNLVTAAKANYRPYGIDFPNGTTGRFTNGRTVVDMIGELLGFNQFIPPFATARDRDILVGVNYASGAAGIRDESGRQLGDRISLNEQLQNHAATFNRSIQLLGTKQAAENYLNKCLYYVSLGSNDYLNNYFMPSNYTTSRLYTPDQYAKVLIDQYSQQIKLLYVLGARKIALPGLGAIGSIPYSFSTLCRNNLSCVTNINNAVLPFNAGLVSLVDQLNRELNDARFIYLNSTGMSSGDPSVLGFRVTNVGCCPARSDGQCIQDSTPCQNRTEYVFWDAIHPTEALNQFTARRSYNAFLPSDAYPTDISHLIS
ncbi:GDSL esterase/lipase At1g29670-like [Populus nigra]|uniref:GDSL esterase/lipase At1g29670-like n=1 Tax=Populus nigra TaxID=3691 RepID=UPI002B279BBC|nr:GDSL esterase/lipase At1g29670-like [Populus nigra]